MKKVETHHAKVPWSWVIWITAPWITMSYVEGTSQGPLIFTLRKFIEDPAYIALVASLNVAFNFLVGVFTSYMSDRIWTRWGRRRPFLIIGWLGVSVAMICVPLATNVWTLVAIVFVYQFCQDVAKPLEPLCNEVIPPAQRGRAATIRNVSQNLFNLFFYGVMIAQFDQVYDLKALGQSIHLNGETVLYWGGSVVLLLTVALLVFKVKETPPLEPAPRERFAIKPFLKQIFGERQWLTVYILYAAPSIATAGIETFDPLIRTEQLGFTKAQFGWAATVGMAINLVIFIPIAGYLTDRVSRIRLLQFGIATQAILGFAFFLYLRLVADYQIPLWTLVGCGVVIAAFKTCMYVVWGPLVYDYIPSNRFGTVSAGFAFVGGIVPFVLINAAGRWINTFTSLFGQHGASKSDYSSIYVLQVFAAVIALLMTHYVYREEKRGRLIKYGRVEIAKAPDAEPEASG